MELEKAIEHYKANAGILFPSNSQVLSWLEELQKLRQLHKPVICTDCGKETDPGSGLQMPGSYVVPYCQKCVAKRITVWSKDNV